MTARFTPDYKQGGGGGGNVPAGAAVMTDAVAFFAEFGLSDSNAAIADTATFDLDASYSDSNAGQTDAATFGFSGAAFDDGLAGRSETIASQIIRYATTNSVVGSVTNPTNAQGENNGTVATVKSAGTVAGTISTLNLNIVAPLAGAGSTPTFLAYYSNTTGTGDTFVNQLSYRQVGQGSNTVVNLTQGNFLTTPFSLVLTNLDQTQPIVVTFSHTALVAATGGSTAVDAVGIQSTGVL